MFKTILLFKLIANVLFAVVSPDVTFSEAATNYMQRLNEIFHYRESGSERSDYPDQFFSNIPAVEGVSAKKYLVKEDANITNILDFLKGYDARLLSMECEIAKDLTICAGMRGVAGNDETCNRLFFFCGIQPCGEMEKQL